MKITQPSKTTRALQHKIKELAVTARERERIRLKLAVTAKKSRLKARKLVVTAKEPSHKAVGLVVVAKENESIRKKLAVTAEALRLKAKELAVTAREKETIRERLAVTAENLRLKAKELATIAKEEEVVRQRLAITAEDLRLKAKKLATIAKEKEVVRQKLAATAEEQIKVEAQSKELEMRYRRLFETAHDGILLLDSDTGQITDVNPFLEKLLGYSKSEFLDKKLWEVGVFKNMQASKDAFKILQSRGYLRYENLPLETKYGRSVEVEFVSNSYMAGDALVIQCNIRDITERKRLDLIKETKRLLDEERSKVESIADATHELRTPVAIIKGNVDLALQGKGKNPKSAKSALRAIDYEIKHISSILTELSLITSKAWELKNRIQFEEIRLKSLIGIVLQRCKPLAHKKNISIKAGEIPELTLLGDKMYLEKMLINLIKNSIIYGSTNGHTMVEVREVKGSIIISVVDDGIGILKEDLPHVFERFFRADKFHSSGGNSVGLGLAIVKWIAEVHGGTVSAESTMNKGSIFTVSLPLGVSATK